MILIDVNILLHAYREGAADHRRFREWLETTIVESDAFGIADLVLSGFVRIVTDPRIFPVAAPVEGALAFCDYLRSQPNAIVLSPGSRHWEIFTELCRRANARGPLVSDAYLAALAIECDCEWISLDRDFARFPGLRWRQPF